jgi:Zn-dependent protease with chaperone function
MFTLVIGLAMWLLSLGMDGALSRWGAMFALGDRMDPASPPVAIAVFSIIFFALTPLQNLILRTCEEEADAFGLNAGREPYGAAMAAMRLSTYRKLRPGRFEEFLFYDHPSGYAFLNPEQFNASGGAASNVEMPTVIALPVRRR